MKLPVTVAVVALALLSAQAGRSRTIALRPNEIPEGAKNFRLTVRRTDGQPFATQANSALYVGIAFGPTLIKFKVTPDEAQSPRALTVEIEDMNAKWHPAPRAGDTLLVAVYREDEPITAATNLRVVEATRASQ